MKGSSGDLCSLIYIISLFIYSSFVEVDSCGDGTSTGFTDLKATPDLRSVKLSWKYTCRMDPAGFVVKICERSRREPSYYFCFERLFKRSSSSSSTGRFRSRDVLKTDDDGLFIAVVHDLRMMTDYTATVEPVDAENFLMPSGRDVFLSRWRPIGAKTSFTTKGFSAYVRKCFFNSSEIVVHTGPFFGGKIAVENALDPRCELHGDRNSSKDIYVLHIDHEICGSVVVNGSSVRTIVAIHESTSVVTHNSRKFLVQCNFLPETFTVEAAFKVPQSDLNPSQTTENTEQHSDDDDSNDIFTYEGYKQNHIKDSRISSVQAASVLQSRKPEYDSQVIGLISIIIIIAVVLLSGLAFGIWWFINSRKYRSGDSLNVSSVPGSTITFYQYGGRQTDDDGYECRIHDQPDASLPHSRCSDYLFRPNNEPSAAEVVLVSLKACK